MEWVACCLLSAVLATSLMSCSSLTERIASREAIRSSSFAMLNVV